MLEILIKNHLWFDLCDEIYKVLYLKVLFLIIFFINSALIWSFCFVLYSAWSTSRSNQPSSPSSPPDSPTIYHISISTINNSPSWVLSTESNNPIPNILIPGPWTQNLHTKHHNKSMESDSYILTWTFNNSYKNNNFRWLKVWSF